MTALVLVFTVYSRAKAKMGPKDVASVLIAAGDAFTDIAFTELQLRTMSNAFQYATGSLLLVFLLLPTACSAYQIRLALASPLLDTQKMQDLSAYYACVLFVALTNMELLRVLPWQPGTAVYDGLPDRRMMTRVWLTVMFLEDLPQFCIQLVVILSVGSASVLAPLSLTFTLMALIWRGLREAACSKGLIATVLPCEQGTLPFMLTFLSPAGKAIYLLPVSVASSHEIALAVTAKGSAAPANPSTPPAGAQSQARGPDPLHLVRERASIQPTGDRAGSAPAESARASHENAALMLNVERPTADTPIGVAWRGERGKLVVTGIDEGSPSAKAGISMGDVVLSINGSAVTSGATAGELVKSAGARVEIVVVRPSHGRS